jgi:HNH endonuclease
MSKISLELDEFVRQRARQRCEYCLNPQMLIPLGLELEHHHPQALGGKATKRNLCLACRECNSHKAVKVQAWDALTRKMVKLFNPRKQNWGEHFEFSEDKTRIIGITACGRVTVESLHMNSVYQTTAREVWVNAGLFPPVAD